MEKDTRHKCRLEMDIIKQFSENQGISEVAWQSSDDIVQATGTSSTPVLSKQRCWEIQDYLWGVHQIPPMSLKKIWIPITVIIITLIIMGIYFFFTELKKIIGICMVTSIRQSRRIFSLSWFSLARRSGWVLHCGFIDSNLLMFPWLKASSKSINHSDDDPLSASKIGWASWNKRVVRTMFGDNKCMSKIFELHTHTQKKKQALLCPLSLSFPASTPPPPVLLQIYMDYLMHWVSLWLKFHLYVLNKRTGAEVQGLGEGVT